MWLPRFLYESLPFSYLALGVVLLGAAFYVPAPYWPEICVAAGLAALVGGAVLILRRKSYRTSRSRLDFDDSGVEPPGDGRRR
jgi:hypothetical protein